MEQRRLSSRRRARQEKPPAPSFNVNNSNEAVRAARADPNPWRVSKTRQQLRRDRKKQIGVVAVIERHEDTGYWSWTIRFRDGRELGQVEVDRYRREDRVDEALDTVIVLA